MEEGEPRRVAEERQRTRREKPDAMTTPLFPISASLRELCGKSFFTFPTFCSVFLLLPAFAECAEIDFEKQVAPILVQNCIRCHNPAKARAGLNLSTRELALKGSDAGEVLIPGKPEESLLIKRAADGSMPPETDGRRLTADEVAVLTGWVKAEAKWPVGRVLSPTATSTVAGTLNSADNLSRSVKRSLVGRVLQHFRARRNLSAAE
jgi:hypothetical protein